MGQSRAADVPADRWRPGRRDVLLTLALAGAGVVAGRFLRSERRASRTLASRSRPMMGTIVEIRVPASGATIDEQAVNAAFEEILRVERVFSPHKPGGGPASEAERQEVDRVLALGQRLHGESDGALDLRVRDWVDLWGWEAEPRRPTPQQLEAVKADRVSRRATAALGEYAFGAVAKGYAVDRALVVLKNHGVTHALVNAGGEVSVLGDDWAVGVQHPRDPGMLLDNVRLDEGQALATSGDYENYFIADDRRWHHLLTPDTGMPAMSCRSVSVRAPSCAEADVWATALFVMGPAAALAAVARHPELQVLIVDADGAITRSAGWASL
ncbi:MAG: FAD:protein FMN transferase, partial [Vicinamibacterales bacterium]|nr:FAD:protein FMN transferase [Vicinamibacterales bacterium]